MFCTKCGNKLDDTARFCVTCGQPTGPADPRQVLPPPLPFGPAGPAPKKLRRITEGKKIAGICAGYAEYFDMDVTLMRLIWLALLLVPPNIGLIAYLVSWMVLPRS
jgi:phage shock protein C